MRRTVTSLRSTIAPSCLLVCTLASVVACGSTTDLHAQDRRTRLGVVGGYVSNEQTWTPAENAEAVGGFVLGAFANVVTPVGWLSITAEGTYTQRGGDVVVTDSDASGTTDRSAIRADYLTLSLHPRATVGLGPADLHVTTGPSIDQLMRSRLSSDLRPVLEDGAGTVFSWAVGAGIGVPVGDRVRPEIEVRMVRGLGDAYSGDFITVRNRSLEVVGRVGLPLPAR